MPRFDTPEPITVALGLSVGHVRITASDRTDTTVELRPSDESDESDVKATAQVRVDYADGTLRVTGPKSGLFDFSRRTRSVDVILEVPSGSELSGELQVGDWHAAGRLGRCRLKTSLGSVRLERTGPLRLDTSLGDITTGDVGGDAEIHTGSGKVRVGAVDGSVEIKNSNGDSTVGAVAGDLRVRAANGDIQVERAGAGVDAKTSNGSIRLGEVRRGAVVLGTAMGNLDIGIAAGTAAWLEVDTGFGHVRNLLEGASGPDAADEKVEIRGRTACGDITVHRA